MGTNISWGNKIIKSETEKERGSGSLSTPIVPLISYVKTHT